jgi:hypothetical protein
MERTSRSIAIVLNRWRQPIRVVVALALASGAYLHAAASAGDVPHDRSRPGKSTIPGSSLANPVKLPSTADVFHLRVKNVRLEPGRAADAPSSTTLKFDMFNEDSRSLTDIVLEVSIVKSPQSDDPAGAPQVLVRPFTVREKIVLQPGFSMTYEVRLRNISGDCLACTARVEVVSVRSLDDGGTK